VPLLGDVVAPVPAGLFELLLVLLELLELLGEGANDDAVLPLADAGMLTNFSAPG